MTLQMPQLPGPLPTWLTGCRTPGVGRQAGVQCAIEAGLAWLANEWESEVKPAKPPGCAIHHQPAERNYDLHFNLPGGFVQVREGGRCGERGLCAVGQSMHVSHPRCVALRGSIYLRGRCACGMEQDQSCVTVVLGPAGRAVAALPAARPRPHGGGGGDEDGWVPGGACGGREDTGRHAAAAGKGQCGDEHASRPAPRLTCCADCRHSGRGSSRASRWWAWRRWWRSWGTYGEMGSLPSKEQETGP